MVEEFFESQLNNLGKEAKALNVGVTVYTQLEKKDDVQIILDILNKNPQLRKMFKTPPVMDDNKSELNGVLNRVNARRNSVNARLTARREGVNLGSVDFQSLMNANKTISNKQLSTIKLPVISVTKVVDSMPLSSVFSFAPPIDLKESNAVSLLSLENLGVHDRIDTVFAFSRPQQQADSSIPSSSSSSSSSKNSNTSKTESKRADGLLDEKTIKLKKISTSTDTEAAWEIEPMNIKNAFPAFGEDDEFSSLDSYEEQVSSSTSDSNSSNNGEKKKEEKEEDEDKDVEKTVCVVSSHNNIRMIGEKINKLKSTQKGDVGVVGGGAAKIDFTKAPIFAHMQARSEQARKMREKNILEKRAVAMALKERELQRQKMNLAFELEKERNLVNQLAIDEPLNYALLTLGVPLPVDLVSFAAPLAMTCISEGVKQSPLSTRPVFDYAMAKERLTGGIRAFSDDSNKPLSLYAKAKAARKAKDDRVRKDMLLSPAAAICDDSCSLPPPHLSSSSSSFSSLEPEINISNVMKQIASPSAIAIKTLIDIVDAEEQKQQEEKEKEKEEKLDVDTSIVAESILSYKLIYKDIKPELTFLIQWQQGKGVVTTTTTESLQVVQERMGDLLQAYLQLNPKLVVIANLVGLSILSGAEATEPTLAERSAIQPPQDDTNIESPSGVEEKDELLAPLDVAISGNSEAAAAGKSRLNFNKHSWKEYRSKKEKEDEDFQQALLNATILPAADDGLVFDFDHNDDDGEVENDDGRSQSTIGEYQQPTFSDDDDNNSIASCSELV